MTSRMILHMLKNLASDDDLEVIVVDLNWTVRDAELEAGHRTRTCNLTLRTVQSNIHMI